MEQRSIWRTIIFIHKNNIMSLNLENKNAEPVVIGLCSEPGTKNNAMTGSCILKRGITKQSGGVSL